nr:uncharacterized protein LOC100342621 isoform X2 [Oryctolagus cuniculus]
MQGSPITSAARPVLRPVLCRLAFREGGGRTAVEGPRPVASAFVRAEFSGLGGRVGERVGFSGGAVEVSALSRLRHPQFLSRLRNSALHCQAAHHARGRVLAHLPEDVRGQPLGHVRGGRSGAQVLPAGPGALAGSWIRSGAAGTQSVAHMECRHPLCHNTGPYIWLLWPELCQSEARSQVLLPGLPCGCRAQALGPSSTALPGHIRELDWKRSNRDYNPVPMWDAGAADNT